MKREVGKNYRTLNIGDRITAKTQVFRAGSWINIRRGARELIGKTIFTELPVTLRAPLHE